MLGFKKEREAAADVAAAAVDAAGKVSDGFMLLAVVALAILAITTATLIVVSRD